MNSTATIDHEVVSRNTWLAASRELLEKEKELSRLSDELAMKRRELPWTRVEKDYQFATSQGRKSLSDLFGPRSQLVVYHFMFGPDWTEGCPGCSYVTDHTNGTLEHLAARDVSLWLVSRGPLEKLLGFEQRMGWKLPWASSGGTDFNHDFGVTFTKEDVSGGAQIYNLDTRPAYSEENPGMSVFFKDQNGAIFHTYSTYARGLDVLLATYVILDRTPKGRDEEGLPQSMAWLRHHDKYEHAQSRGTSCCHSKNG